MSKLKKTRNQKKRSDQRRATALPTTPVSTPEHTYTLSLPTTPPATKQPEHSYTYVFHDLSKTFFVTSIIIFLELVLSLLMQHHIINLPL